MELAVTTYEPSTALYTLHEDYEHEGITVPMLLEIRAGARFTASVPRLLWTAMSPADLSLEAGLVHDHLYQGGGAAMGISRKQADEEFRAIMWQRGVSAWRVDAAYRAVRTFGGASWTSG